MSWLQSGGVWGLNFLILLVLMIHTLVYGEPVRTKNSTSAQSFYFQRKLAEEKQRKVRGPFQQPIISVSAVAKYFDYDATIGNFPQ